MPNPSDTQAAAPNTAQTIPQTTTDPTDLVLLIFIHGFKGTDSTFGEFPQRLQHILSESIDNTVVESVVFPAYETKGELNAAVVRFADWLTDLTVKREVANGGAGKAKVVLCGHSMGGLLAADALLEFVRTRPDKRAPLWPKIVACIAYDTPYLGLHPGVVKNSANQAAQYARTAQNVLNSFKTWRSKTPSGAAAAAAGGAAVGAAAIVAAPAPIDTNASSDTPKEGDEAPKSPTTPKTPTAESSEGATVTSLWQKWAAPAALAIGGAVLAGTAAGAYYKREEIGVGYTWVTDHLKYVGNLWSKDELEARLNRLLELESRMGVLFQTFFTNIPASPPAYPNDRTFIVLPHRNSLMATHFAPNRNTLASDEIQAHTGMFDTKTNDGYYELGLMTAKLIREAVFNARRAEANAQIPQPPRGARMQSQTLPQQPNAVKAADPESVASRQPAPTSLAGPLAAAGGVAVAATTVAAATAAPVVPSAPAAPSSAAADDEDEEEDDDDDEEEESEEEEEHIPVMEKPHVMVEKADAAQDVSAPKAEEEEEDDEDGEEDDEDEDEDDDEEEDDDDDDDDEEEDEDEDEEEEAEAQPAKK